MCLNHHEEFKFLNHNVAQCTEALRGKWKLFPQVDVKKNYPGQTFFFISVFKYLLKPEVKLFRVIILLTCFSRLQ